MFLADIPLNIDWQQILLHALNFVILAGGLYFLLYSPVKKFMAERKSHYEKMDNDANEKAKSVEEKEINVNERIANLNSEIRQTRLDANKQIEEFRARELKAAEEDAKEIIKKAQVEAEKYKEKAVKDANKEIAEIVTSVAEKLSLSANESESIDDFLDKALDEAKK